MNCFSHTQKFMKIMKFYPPIINFSTHLGSVECNRLITAKNSTLVIETGPEEVEIMTKMRKNIKEITKFK